MSFSRLASRLSEPYIAATTLGVLGSAFFVVGNSTASLLGVLPYVTASGKTSTVSEKLAGWKYNFDHGKRLFGSAAVLSSVAYATSAVLAPRALKTPLWIAYAACFSVPVWTLTVMKSTNNSLISLNETVSVTDKYVHESEVDTLISKWKRLNNVRIAIVTVAYGAGLGALLLAF